MARTLTKTTRASAKRTAEPAPKKRLGRPLGSKNRVPPAAKARAKSTPVARRGAVRKPAAATPKMNKAELEAQVTKLERTVARLRKQVTELKQTTREEPVEAPKPAAPAAKAATTAKPKRAAAPRARGRAKPTDEQGAETTSEDEAAA